RRRRALGVVAMGGGVRRAGGAGAAAAARCAGAGAGAGGGDRGGEAAAPHPPVRQLTSLLAARGVGRRYGDHVALEATDVEVRGGEVLALVGPNGAGKSTLLGILAGALPPSEGTVEVGPDVRVGWMSARPAHYS